MKPPFGYNHITTRDFISVLMYGTNKEEKTMSVKVSCIVSFVFFLVFWFGFKFSTVSITAGQQSK